MTGIVVARQHVCPQSRQRKLGVHKRGMLLIDTETEGTHLIQPTVAYVLLHLLQDEPCAEIVLRVDTRELRHIVAVPTPFHLRQVHIVGYAVIMERGEQPSVQSGGQSYLG